MDQVSIVARFLGLWSFLFNLIWEFIINIYSNCLTVPLKDLKLIRCNKDKAVRAKTIAEKKFADKDYAGAKKFALKAQTLYPGLDGISHMLSTLDVYICYEKKVNGESDWYGILNVNPSDDDETIRKQYRKLLLILHPDKNTSVGADDAFKILQEAWTLLSHNSKRAEYNQRRNPKVSSPKERPSADRSPKDSNSTTTSPAPNPHPATTPAPTQAPVDQGIYLFWTNCYGCKSRHQYHRMYVNQVIRCCYCNTTFIAAEMPVPINTTPPTQPTGLWAESLRWSNNNTTSPAPIPHAATTPAPAPAPVDQGIPQFWTSCYGCKRHLIYNWMYVNQVIKCWYCNTTFVNTEMRVPMNTIPPTHPTGLWPASIRYPWSDNNTYAQFGGQWSNVNQGSNFYPFIPGSNSFGCGFY